MKEKLSCLFWDVKWGTVNVKGKCMSKIVDNVGIFDLSSFSSYNEPKNSEMCVKNCIATGQYFRKLMYTFLIGTSKQIVFWLISFWFSATYFLT